MFITPLGRSGAFLFVGYNVVVEGPGGEAFAQHTHEELVDARHECDGSEVGRVGRVVFLVDEDCGGVFPTLRHVLLAEASIEDEREDFAVGIGSFQVLVFHTVGARSGVGG